jgi:hypothetical protein
MKGEIKKRMMKANNKIESEVSLIMKSGKIKSKLKSSPFLVTRVMAKIEDKEEINQSIRWGCQFVKIAVVVLVMINVINFTLFHKVSETKNSDQEIMEIVQQEYAHIYSDFMLTDEFIIE